MCLILFSWKETPGHDLVLLANRDEFLARPTRQADFWEDHPDILGGRDLEEGGSWLAVGTNRRMAAVTNVREPGRTVRDPISRGHLVTAFLTSMDSARHFARATRDQGDRYNGFNLLLYDGKELVFVSNRSTENVRVLPPGLYGLSNADLDTPWPKVESGKEDLERVLSGNPGWSLTDLMPILMDTTKAPDADLPRTGVPLEWERILSARCIRSPEYATRSSSIVLVTTDGGVTFRERTHQPNPHDVTFELIPCQQRP
ncbi:MAG: NRDE family protein [Rhodothermales bacterium]